MSQYNESEKILLLHQYVTSGLTLHEFSSRHGIPLSTFHRIYTAYGSPDVSSLAYLIKTEDMLLTRELSLRRFTTHSIKRRKRKNVKYIYNYG